MKTGLFICTIIFSILISLTALADESKLAACKGEYFGQTPPGLEPVRFAPEIFDAEHGYHSPVVFSPDLTEAIWGPMERSSVLMYSHMVDGAWTTPEQLLFGFDRDVGDGCFSPDGSRICFVSAHQIGEGAPVYERIWYSERTARGWSEPRLIGDEVAKHPTHWTFSIAKNGNLYFTSEILKGGNQQGLVCVRFDGEKYLAPVDLGPAVNSPGNEMAACIAPDESYLIFTRKGADTKKTDLYISFRDADNNWTEAVEMTGLNSEAHDLGAALSPDGKYLFFLSQRESNNKIYWVDARVIDQYRPK